MEQDRARGGGEGYQQCLAGSECLMTCYGDQRCEACCKDCCETENSECTAFTFYRFNEARSN